MKHLLICCICKKRQPAKRFRWKIGHPTAKKLKEVNPMLEITITNEEKVNVKITPTTTTGRPATIDGKPTWTVASGEGTLEVSEDGLSAFIVSADVPGETMVVVEADADLGEGVETISDSIKVAVQGSRAVNLGLVAEAPIPK